MSVQRKTVDARIHVIILLAPTVALVVKDGFSLLMGEHALVCLFTLNILVIVIFVRLYLLK